jgi:hypothetical protein
MTSLCKPFYHIDEALARWGMSERDLAAFVLADKLTLSATVAGLRVQFGSIEDMEDGQWNRLPEGWRRIIGTIDLWRDDGWRVLQQGHWSVHSLKAAAGAYLDVDDGLDNEHLVTRDDLVIGLTEMQRFEATLALPTVVTSADPAPLTRRGAPSRYDWDAFWIEVCRIIYEDGVPHTQGELVAHLLKWFANHHRVQPDESTIKKKIKPLWHTIQQDAPTKASRTG